MLAQLGSRGLGRPLQAEWRDKPSLLVHQIDDGGVIHRVTALFEVSEIFRNLGPDADRVRAFFFTVDPERDNPAALKEYLSSFDPRLSGLTGSLEDIAAVAKSYRAIYRKVPLDQGGYTMDHTAIVYLMDKQGRFVAPFSLKRTTEASAAELRKHL